MKRLIEYDYPGNIRELQNILEHALILCKGEELSPEALPAFLPPDHPPANAAPSPSRLQDLEIRTIVQALEESQWNKSQALVCWGSIARLSGANSSDISWCK